MFSIKTQALAKKYQRDWIFRGVDLDLSPNDSVILLGGNGSGKSTLLQTLIGSITPSKGEINYYHDEKVLDKEYWYKEVSIAAPYLDIYEELTIHECIDNQRSFKPFLNDLSTQEIVGILELDKAKKKHIYDYSSGMKQRLKLGLAILAKTKVLALDEPTMNLDKHAIQWFQSLVSQHLNNRIVITCSNEQVAEYTHATKQLNLMDFKP
ncbi:MAG: ABC-type multidrug transport system ATPase subunit [Flavobacteriales bacterium]|jgi:ABC-type multidrug transport system ATPase subunit